MVQEHLRLPFRVPGWYRKTRTHRHSCTNYCHRRTQNLFHNVCTPAHKYTHTQLSLHRHGLPRYGRHLVCDCTLMWWERSHTWSVTFFAPLIWSFTSKVTSNKKHRKERPWKSLFSSLTRGLWLGPEASADLTYFSLYYQTKVGSGKEKQEWAFEIKSGVVSLPPQLRFFLLM